MIDRSTQVRALFDEARARPDAERDAWLEACGVEQDLVDEVRELLRLADRQRSPLDRPLMDRRRWAELDTAPAAEAPPSEVAGYEIVKPIGRGGMGTVYEAVQESPRRHVAIKLLREGMASESALRRFQLEAEALGRLDHPHVASIYEAGSTVLRGSSRPYLVMELIDGQSWARSPAVARAGLTQRLELLARVGEGVAHAHARGVVHRDLKPDNVLVDAELRPRIVDFGMARLIEGDDDSNPLATAQGVLVGTLAYMSPEQAAANRDRIDARSDVYSLGVMGYELLTGRLPYDVDGLDLPDALRVITERAGPRAGSVSPELRGDVETMLAVAMAKEPARRYQSAAEFVADVRRVLNDEPISARRPSTAEQLRRFARQHRALAGSLSSGLVLMLAGLVAMAWGLSEAHDREQTNKTLLVAEREARQAEQQARRALETEQAQTLEAQARTQRALDETRALLDFVTDMMSAVHPDQLGWDVRMSDILDTAAERLTHVDAGDRVRASMEETLGRAYLSLGRWEPAARHLQRAWTTWSRVEGEDADRALQAQGWLGEAWRRDGRAISARELQEDHLARLDRLHGDRHPATLEAELQLTSSLLQLGELTAGLARAESVVERTEDHLGTDHELTQEARLLLARLASRTGDSPRARALVDEVLAIRTTQLGADHLQTLAAISEQARLSMATADLHGALQARKDLLAGYARALGPDHPQTFATRASVGRTLTSMGRWDEALEAFEAAETGLTEAVGRDHGETLSVRRSKANLLVDLGLYDRAKVELAGILEAREGQHDGHGWVHSVRRSLGFVHMVHGDFAAARDELEAALAALAEQGESGRLERAHALMDLANVDLNEWHLVDGERRLLEAEAIYADLLGASHQDVLAARMNRARFVTASGRHAEAQTLLLDVIAGLRAALSSDHPTVMRAVLFLAQNSAEARQLEQAEGLVDTVTSSLAGRLAPDHPLLVEAQLTRADVLTLRGQLETARAALDELSARLAIEADEVVPELVVRRIRWHVAAGRTDRAESVVQEALTRVDHATLASAQLRYQAAWIRLEAGDVDEAEAMLTSLHAGAAARWGPDGWDARRAASRLAEICEAEGRDDEAQVWRTALGADVPVPHGFLMR